LLISKKDKRELEGMPFLPHYGFSWLTIDRELLATSGVAVAIEG
jgi:hypothetical protein